jgi:glycosyltransferase involved in cell wall biosynthesis
LKILHLVHNYYPSIGGSQNLFQHLSEGLVRDYHEEVKVYTTNAMFSPHAACNISIPAGIEMHNGVEIHRFPFNTTYPRLYRTIKKLGLPLPFGDLWSQVNAGPLSLKMYNNICNSDAEIIASTPIYYLNTFYPKLTNRQKNKPFVVFGSLHAHQNHISRLLLNQIRKADAYVAHTPFEKEYLEQRGIDPAKMHVFGIGVDVDQLSAGNGKKIREQYHLGNAPVVLYFGRHAPYKGIDTLIRAMKIVWKTKPEAYLIIAGSTSPFTKTIQNMIDDLPDSERGHAILIGSVSEQDKVDLYQTADIFTTVSSQESFGIVYLEAWACGKPVIGGRIGAVQSLINEGEDGLLVEIGNSEELGEKIDYLLAHPAEMQRMGKAGFHRVLKDFTWPVITAKVHNLYQSLLER